MSSWYDAQICTGKTLPLLQKRFKSYLLKSDGYDLTFFSITSKCPITSTMYWASYDFD